MLQIFRSCMDSPRQIVVIRTHKGILKIPGILCKCIIVDMESKCFQIIHILSLDVMLRGLHHVYLQ